MTDLRQNPIYVSVYVFWLKLIFVEVVPYCGILVCNILLISAICRPSGRFAGAAVAARKRARSSSSAENADLATTAVHAGHAPTVPDVGSRVVTPRAAPVDDCDDDTAGFPSETSSSTVPSDARSLVLAMRHGRIVEADR